MSEDREMIDKLRASFASWNHPLVFVHSDVMRGLSVPRHVPFDRKRFLEGHFEAIRQVTGTEDLWFPAFNYAFSQSRVFDQRQDRSEVGYLSEHVRTNVSTWRTPVPCFSICGSGPEPKLAIDAELDAFGRESVFGKLVERDGLIFNYGCNLAALTFIHFCERLADCPYRYTKAFTGRIIDMTGTERTVRIRFHVRPLNHAMSYDWGRLEQDLVQHGLLESLAIDDRDFQIISSRPLTEYWLERLAEEPLFFLTDETKSWVEPTLQELGRGFVIDDFETIEVTNYG